jgi:hypothetical protein
LLIGEQIVTQSRFLASPQGGFGVQFEGKIRDQCERFMTRAAAAPDWLRRPLARSGARLHSRSNRRRFGGAIRAKCGMAHSEMSEEERAALSIQLERLREEHRDLDAAIEALLLAGQADQLQLQRLKKRKLLLRDRLTQLEDALTPDIIA